MQVADSQVCGLQLYKVHMQVGVLLCLWREMGTEPSGSFCVLQGEGDGGDVGGEAEEVGR